MLIVLFVIFILLTAYLGDIGHSWADEKYLMALVELQETRNQGYYISAHPERIYILGLLPAGLSGVVAVGIALIIKEKRRLRKRPPAAHDGI